MAGGDRVVGHEVGGRALASLHVCQRGFQLRFPNVAALVIEVVWDHAAGGKSIGEIAFSEGIDAPKFDGVIGGFAVVLSCHAIGLATGGVANGVDGDANTAQAVDQAFAR